MGAVCFFGCGRGGRTVNPPTVLRYGLLSTNGVMLARDSRKTDRQKNGGARREPPFQNMLEKAEYQALPILNIFVPQVGQTP